MKKLLIAIVVLSSGFIVGVRAHAQLLPASSLNLGNLEAKTTQKTISPVANTQVTLFSAPDVEPATITATPVIGAINDTNVIAIDNHSPVEPSINTSTSAHGNNYGLVEGASSIPATTNITPAINLNQPTEPVTAPATTGSTGGSTNGGTGVISVGSYNTYHPVTVAPTVAQPTATSYQTATSQSYASKAVVHTQAAKVVKEAIPLLQTEDDFTGTKSTGNDYAASTRGIGIGISLFGVLLAIAAVLGIVVMVQEYQERKRVSHVVYQ